MNNDDENLELLVKLKNGEITIVEAFRKLNNNSSGQPYTKSGYSFNSIDSSPPYRIDEGDCRY